MTSRQKPQTWKVALAIGRVTFSEIIRDKVLYNIILIAILLLGLSILAAKVTFIGPDRVLLDFGLSAVGLSCTMIATFTGSAMLGKEYDRRTVFVALSHPISKLQFIIGKFCGLAAVITVNWLLLSTLLMVMYVLVGGVLNWNFPLALFLICIQNFMLGALAVFFSSFTTTSLSVIFMIGTYLLGTNISQIRLVATNSQSALAKMSLNSVSQVIPNLEHFSLGTKVIYNLPVTSHFVAVALTYALVVISLALVTGGVLLNRREQ